MNKQNQNGSAHVIVAVAILSLLVAGIGYLLWKNFISRDAVNNGVDVAQNSPRPSDTPEQKLLTGQIDSLFPAKLSWKYPADWGVKTAGKGPTSQNDATTQTITLTSPSTNYEVVYSVGANGGLGGTCLPESAGKIQYINKKEILGFSNVIFVEYISTADAYSGGPETNGYTYSSSILQGQTRPVEVGSSFCSVYLRQVIDLAKKYDTTLLDAKITIKEIENLRKSGSNAQDLETVKKHYEIPEYQQAVDILLSTRKE